jgi:monoamine oxidase
MDTDVIVIGAGAAGLAAARSLAQQALRVAVVEGRDRIGGRVRWVPSPRASLPAELGAEFIHGPASETMALLRDAGYAAVETGGDAWIRGDDGKIRNDDREFLSSANIIEKARSLAADESVDRYLARFERDDAMRDAVAGARAFVEGFEAADPALASVRAIADELHSGVDSVSARPLGGYPPLFERLHDECVKAGARIELSTRVRRIAWERGSVVVDTNAVAGASRTLRARAAIVTLPVGVLRHTGDEYEVVFEPALTPGKCAAIDTIEMGHVVKVMMWFRSAFWERVRDGRYRGAGFFRDAKGPFGAYWTQWPIRSEMIAAWIGGPRTAALSLLSDAERIQCAVRGFGDLFGETELAHKEFEGGATHDWGSDPFARGAYSYVAVGGGDARKVLGDPVDDTLFFAGEATSTDGQGGTVNGAFETGERAAREVLAALGKER